jgi:glycosyltransferase involved in cell wall biosynthesis
MRELRLGVLDFHPIQYHAPLYLRLTERGQVSLDVLYLSDWGCQSMRDPEFGISLSWDVDLLSGYQYRFLSSAGRAPDQGWRIHELAGWLRTHDVIVIHGYSNPWMQTATAVCRLLRIPYLLRGDAAPQGQLGGLRRYVRDTIARTVVAGSAGGLAIGQLNAAFYRKYGAQNVTFAPHSVDNERFAQSPTANRADLLARWGLAADRPVVMFCGKLHPRKRPLDILEAIGPLLRPVTTLFVGDGELADELRSRLAPGSGIVTGFVNQSELPAYYHATDILVLPSTYEPWGLVVNEAMAGGALPVVSDRVGAGPDLVIGLGEVYPCGDLGRLTTALRSALARIVDPGLPELIRRRINEYSLDRTAEGFEQAALAAGQR